MNLLLFDDEMGEKFVMYIYSGWCPHVSEVGSKFQPAFYDAIIIGLLLFTLIISYFIYLFLFPALFFISPLFLLYFLPLFCCSLSI